MVDHANTISALSCLNMQCWAVCNKMHVPI